jgi:hypothetical protein
MRSKMLIESTEDAVNKILIIDNINLNGSVSLVGSSIIQEVAIEIPAVEDPDVDTDSDWDALVYESTTYLLDADNNRRSIPFRGMYRISKPASSGNAFGVRFD